MISNKYLYLENPFKTMKKLKGVFKPLKCFVRFGYAPIGYCNGKISITCHDVEWKDKYKTPRFEGSPSIIINFFHRSISFIWEWEETRYYCYWEQALWYLYYYEDYNSDVPDIQKAKESWPWIDVNNKSTWQDKYLINERKR